MIYENAVTLDTTSAYNIARSDIESILNSTSYTNLEVPLGDYPTGMDRLVVVFPVVDSVVQKIVTIQILYKCDDTTNTHHIFHMTLLPGPNHEAITLIPHRNSFEETKADDNLHDHTSLNTVSTLKRDVNTCYRPPKCKKYCSGCHKYHSNK
ncbi:MAG: hypothetical protein COA94_08715 [Rickettsiales bacterium]|nr:MAG: hypothetical protein COA94_08715 [Rickettsiales bacterium]